MESKRLLCTKLKENIFIPVLTWFTIDLQDRLALMRILWLDALIHLCKIKHPHDR